MPEFLVIPNEFEEQRLLKNYDMTKEQIKKDVAVVRDWMSSQSNLPKFPESKNGKYDFVFVTVVIFFFYFFTGLQNKRIIRLRLDSSKILNVFKCVGICR